MVTQPHRGRCWLLCTFCTVFSHLLQEPVFTVHSVFSGSGSRAKSSPRAPPAEVKVSWAVRAAKDTYISRESTSGLRRRSAEAALNTAVPFLRQFSHDGRRREHRIWSANSRGRWHMRETATDRQQRTADIDRQPCSAVTTADLTSDVIDSL